METFGQFIFNHWQLWLAFFVILLLIFINEIVTQKQQARALSPQASVDLMNHQNATVIDLRETDKYKKATLSILCLFQKLLWNPKSWTNTKRNPLF
jgi:hypothetical protein